MRFLMIGAAAFVAACGQPQAPAASPIEEIIAVDQAMLADAASTGWVDAFASHAAPDAVVLQEQPIDARAFYATIDPANRGDTTLLWTTDFAGASVSEGLGFTFAPFNGDNTAYGYALLVWKRQPDGSWKWIFNDGVNTTAPPTFSTGAAVRLIEPGAEGTDTAVDIAEAETALASQALTDPAGAIASVLAPEGRVSREDAAPVVGPDAARQALAAGPPSIDYEAPLRTEATADLAFTLGEARWEGGAGFYARIWVLSDEGWKVAVDQMIPRLAPAVD